MRGIARDGPLRSGAYFAFFIIFLYPRKTLGKFYEGEKKTSNQGISVRAIVEDRIVTLKEELFFRDEN